VRLGLPGHDYDNGHVEQIHNDENNREQRRWSNGQQLASRQVGPMRALSPAYRPNRRSGIC
jgi:hypothetical protein